MLFGWTFLVTLAMAPTPSWASETLQEKRLRLQVEVLAEEFTLNLCSPLAQAKDQLRLLKGITSIVSDGAWSTAVGGDLLDILGLTPSTKYLIRSDGYWRALEKCYGLSEASWMAFTTSIISADIAGHAVGGIALAETRIVGGALKGTTKLVKWMGTFLKQVVPLRLADAVTRMVQEKFLNRYNQGKVDSFQKLWIEVLRNEDFVSQARRNLDTALRIYFQEAQKLSINNLLLPKKLFLSLDSVFRTVQLPDYTFVVEIPSSDLNAPRPIERIVLRLASDFNDTNSGYETPLFDLPKLAEKLKTLSAPLPVETGLAKQDPSAFAEYLDWETFTFDYRKQRVPGQLAKRDYILTPCGALGVQALFREMLAPCQSVNILNLVGEKERQVLEAQALKKEYRGQVQTAAGSLVTQGIFFYVAQEVLTKVAKQALPSLAKTRTGRFVTFVGTFIVSYGMLEYIAPSDKVKVLFEGDLPAQSEFLRDFSAYLFQQLTEAPSMTDSKAFSDNIQIFLTQYPGQYSVQILK